MKKMEQQPKIPLVVVAGPTASGKTGLAVALAKALDGEVVSADSMQIYKRMAIATAKPTEQEMQGVPHHLIDFVEPDDAAFSVADYARLAHQTIEEIAARGHLPILAGGTGLYIRAVTDNIDYTQIHSNAQLRGQLAQQAAQIGNEAMLEQLRQIDPLLADKLHPNDIGRILRALEVYRLTGVTMSEHQRRARETQPRYAICMLGITFENRALLYERVNRRVDDMMERGLLKEAQEILESYGGTARQAIGYKELAPFLRGELPLDICVEKLKQATRNYAKRQLSWFRYETRIQWLLHDRMQEGEILIDAAQLLVHKSGII